MRGDRIKNDGGKIDSFALSPRELEVVQLLANGEQPKTIATKLGITIVTVRVYILSAKRKTGAFTIPHLVGIARELNLVSIKVDLPERKTIDAEYL